MNEDIRDPFRPDMTLLEARQVLRPRADVGELCPCCTQLVKVYRRLLTGVPVRAVIALYEDHGLEFGHMPTVAQKHLPEIAHQGGYLVLGAHWSLIAEERASRPDDGRTGYWHVTGVGEEFLRGELPVPKYAHLYNGRCLGLSGDLVRVDEALGEHFDYRALMDRRLAAGIPPTGGEAAPLFTLPPDHGPQPRRAA